MKKIIVSLGVLLTLYFFTVALLGMVTIKKARKSNSVLLNYRFDVPHDLNFCDEPAPLNNVEFRKKLDQQLYNYSYYKTGNYLLHKRASLFLKQISRILKSHNLPDDLKYIALVESQLLNTRSKKGAAGYWQFMPNTARECGLMCNTLADERLNLISSSEAACKLFRKSYNSLNNWTLVAAAYNSGINNLQKRIKKQKSNEYYSLDLSKETEQYMIRILAMKEIFEHPENYGYHFKKSDLYKALEYKIVEVDTAILNIPSFIKSQCVDENCFYVFNPWITGSKLVPDSGKKFKFLIPNIDPANFRQLNLMRNDDSLSRSGR